MTRLKSAVVSVSRRFLPSLSRSPFDPRPIGTPIARSRVSGTRSLALAAALVVNATIAHAASATFFDFSLGGTDSLTWVVDSLAASTWSNRLLRYRPDIGSISKMTTDVPPNSNLVALGTSVWFTSRDMPYRIGRADLGSVTGEPTYYGPAGMLAPYDDMALGLDNSLWATNAASGKIVRVTQGGAVTVHSGNGAIQPVGIARGVDGGMWFADRGNRRISRIDPLTGAIADYAIPQTTGVAIPERVAVASTGIVWFSTQSGFGSVDPSSGAVTHVTTGTQTPRRLAAATDGTLWLTDGTPTITQFTPPSGVARLTLFAEPDAKSAGLYIDPTGAVYASDPQWWHLARIDVAANTPADATIVEFHNATLGHYFITADSAEAAAIDAGSAGAGWVRTGQSWKTWTKGPIPNATQVCRFYGSTAIDASTGRRRGPNSHFYTVQPGECAGVKLDAGWTYEGAGSFWMLKATNGFCPSGSQPVYRAYNNRYAQNDSNHRYSTNASIYAQMIVGGWSGEGVVMCAPA